MAVSLRPIRPDDEGFLYRLYASTRADEMALLVAWTNEQKEQFLRFQFTAQHTYYQQQFAQAAFDIVLLDDQPVGRLYVDRREDEIHIVDIALLPAYRNQGIGTSLLRDIFAQAARSNRVVRIHVEKFNPALRLYTRLGFRPVVDKGIYLLMERLPDPSSELQSQSTGEI